MSTNKELEKRIYWLVRFFIPIWSGLFSLIFISILLTTPNIKILYPDFTEIGWGHFVSIFKIPLSFLAIGIPIYGIILTLYRSIQNEDQIRLLKENRRAYMAPSEDPGHLKLNTDLLANEPRLLISFENYGINPADKIEGILLSFNEADVVEMNNSPIANFTTYFNCYNPIPSNSRWIIKLNKQRLGVSDISILLSNYLILKLKYYDKILGQEFNDSFLWKVDTGGKLAEIDNHYEKLIELSKSFPLKKAQKS